MGGYLLLTAKPSRHPDSSLIVFFRISRSPHGIMLGLWLGMQFIGGVGAVHPTSAAWLLGPMLAVMWGWVLTFRFGYGWVGQSLVDQTDGHPRIRKRNLSASAPAASQR